MGRSSSLDFFEDYYDRLATVIRDSTQRLKMSRWPEETFATRKIEYYFAIHVSH